MKAWIVAAAGLAIAVAIGVSALAYFGIWPGPSDADRQRSRVMTAIAQSKLEAGDQLAALRELDNAIAVAPIDEALRARASIYMARNNFDGALRDTDKLIFHGHATADDYSLRCWLRARGTDVKSARADCDHALEMVPTLASALGTRGIVNLRLGIYRDAWTDFNEAMRIGGSDHWLAWRLFGRGLATWGRGNAVSGREDIEMALHSDPTIASQYAQFGLGINEMNELESATYAAAVQDGSLLAMRVYLIVYPNGAHVTEARARVQQTTTWIAQSEAEGQRALPGFSLGHARGPAGPDDDSFGAIAVSESAWRVAFATDYPSPGEAELAGATACNTVSVHDCHAYAFRNVCAALALSRPEHARGMAWAHGEDEAVRGAVEQCHDHGGRACAAIYSQCTPTPASGQQ